MYMFSMCDGIQTAVYIFRTNESDMKRVSEYGQSLFRHFCQNSKRRDITIRNFKRLPPKLGEALFGNCFPRQLKLCLIEKVFPSTLNLTLRLLGKRQMIATRKQLVRDVLDLIETNTQLNEVDIQTAPQERIQDVQLKRIGELKHVMADRQPLLTGCLTGIGWNVECNNLAHQTTDAIRFQKCHGGRGVTPPTLNMNDNGSSWKLALFDGHDTQSNGRFTILNDGRELLRILNSFELFAVCPVQGVSVDGGPYKLNAFCGGSHTKKSRTYCITDSSSCETLYAIHFPAPSPNTRWMFYDETERRFEPLEQDEQLLLELEAAFHANQVCDIPAFRAKTGACVFSRFELSRFSGLVTCTRNKYQGLIMDAARLGDTKALSLVRSE